MENLFLWMDKIIVSMDKVGLPASLCCVGPVAVLFIILELANPKRKRDPAEKLWTDDR